MNSGVTQGPLLSLTLLLVYTRVNFCANTFISTDEEITAYVIVQHSISARWYTSGIVQRYYWSLPKISLSVCARSHVCSACSVGYRTWADFTITQFTVSLWLMKIHSRCARSLPYTRTGFVGLPWSRHPPSGWCVFPYTMLIVEQIDFRPLHLFISLKSVLPTHTPIADSRCVLYTAPKSGLDFRECECVVPR